ncbi:MAG: right-handed parallel beta-helix repeat-containing protein [Planctomycetota bacterium]
MIGRVLMMAVLAALMVVAPDMGGGAEFYVDPDFAGQGRDGSAGNPWNSIRGAGTWQTINAALAKGPVTVYFSARQADLDQPQKIREFVECRRSDTSTHRLTLDGMSKYNANDREPIWSDYSGPHLCCIIDQKNQRALGWERGSTNSPKQNYVTIRGFECTGPGARVGFAGDHVIFEHLYIHDVTEIGPGILVFGTFEGGPGHARRVMDECTDMTIRDCRIENVYGEGIYVGCLYPFWLEEEAFRKAVGNEHSNVTIERVAIKNTGVGGGQGDGIDFKVGITNVTVRDCNISGVTGMAGIILSSSVIEGADQNVLIERCRIHDAGPGSEARRAIYAGAGSILGYRGLTIRNCVVNSMPRGIAVYKSDPNGRVSDVTVVNNTVYDVRDTVLVLQADNAVVMNNLLFDNDDGKRQAFISGDNMQSDYNAYRGALKSPDEGKKTIVLTEQQEQQLKADLAGKSFTLPSTAAVVDKGTALQGFSDDVLGIKRPQGAAWDIGAHEYARPADKNK